MLAVSNEKVLFKVNIVVASIIWVLIIFGTFGIGLSYIVFGYVFFLFSHSALISHLKGNSVLITSQQFPDIYEKIEKATEKLKMPMPSVFLMNGNGILNAFATKFLRRSYIALYSDVIDSLEERNASIDFYIGHELGHLHRNHLKWWPFFLPLYALPLLMPAYRRACEMTCDQYGRFCSETSEDAVRALAVLAVGNSRWKGLSAAHFTDQIKETGGFWMSFHELTDSYPWLSKRVAMVQNLESEKSFPQRPFSSRILGLFCPGFMRGAFLPIILVYLFVIGAVLGIPALMMVKEKLKQGSSAVTYPATTSSISETQ